MSEETFSRWHQAAGPWAQWIKPSLFAGRAADGPPLELVAPAIEWLPYGNDTALVLDLPGVEAVQLGAALNARGACPVPLFNTTADLFEVVRTADVIAALSQLAPALTPRTAGPPVFLLDSMRESGSANVGAFDNRWYVFASDFPGEERLKAAGVSRLVVVCQTLAADLHDALARHEGLERSLLAPGAVRPQPFPRNRSGIVRGLSSFGRVLHKNLDGTFGHRISSG